MVYVTASQTDRPQFMEALNSFWLFRQVMPNLPGNLQTLLIILLNY